MMPVILSIVVIFVHSFFSFSVFIQNGYFNFPQLTCLLPVPPHHYGRDDLSVCLSAEDTPHPSVSLSHRLLKREAPDALWKQLAANECEMLYDR